jgi:hypothetical protein
MLPGKSSFQALEFIKPTQEQIWFCLNRLLIFDEPLNRYERLEEILSRYINNKNGKAIRLANYSPSEKNYFFKQIFGSRSKNNIDSQLLNFSLAMEDIFRFTPIAFQLWSASFNNEIKTESNLLFSQLQLSEPEKKWLVHASESVPDWHTVKDSGPWSQDVRANFIIEYLNKLSKIKTSLTIEKYINAHNEFSQLLNKWRSRLPAGFLPQLIVLVEGPTEEILLPHFAKQLNASFTDPAICIIPCGGSKQLLKKFLVLKEITKLPIITILDHDAKSEIELVKDALRPTDFMHVWQEGEIEDIFPVSFLIEYVNRFLSIQEITNLITEEEIATLSAKRRILALDNIWQIRALGKFDKIGFANFIKDNLSNTNEVPEQAKALVKLIHSFAIKQKAITSQSIVLK